MGAKARECGAFTRARGIVGAEALWRVLLIPVANGCSLAETAVRAQQRGLGHLNPSAVYKRLRSAAEWLRWTADQRRSRLGMVRPPQGAVRARGRRDLDLGTRQHGNRLANSLRHQLGESAV